jgi:hypothetical protein
MLACAIINKTQQVLMANLSVRKLDKKAYERLRVRAANHGVSMEEEARQIIYTAVFAPEKITLIFQKYFGHDNCRLSKSAFCNRTISELLLRIIFY